MTLSLKFGDNGSEGADVVLKKIADELWCAEQPVRFFGCNMTSRMTVVRLSDNRLFIHSPIRLTDELRSEIDGLGTVSHIVGPNMLHHMSIPEWKLTYGSAQTLGSPRLVKRKKAYGFDAAISDHQSYGWEGGLKHMIFRGNALLDEVVFLHAASKTLILTDLCMQAGEDSTRSMRVLGKMFGFYGQTRPPLELRWLFRDKMAGKAAAEKVLTWPFDRIIISHGDIVAEGGRETFREAFEFLLHAL